MSALLHMGLSPDRDLTFSAAKECNGRTIVLWAVDGATRVSVTMTTSELRQLQHVLNETIRPNGPGECLPTPNIRDIAPPAAPMPLAVNQQDEE